MHSYGTSNPGNLSACESVETERRRERGEKERESWRGGEGERERVYINKVIADWRIALRKRKRDQYKKFQYAGKYARKMRNDTMRAPFIELNEQTDVPRRTAKQCILH